MFSSLVPFVSSVCKIVLVAGCIYAGVGFLVLQFTKRQNKPVGPVIKNAIKSESESHVNKEPPSVSAAVGYKSFMNEIQHASSLSKKEYKALKAKMAQSNDLHGEIRKHIKNHITESEIKVIKQLIRKNYAEKHQYTTEQFTDEFLHGELYSLVKKPHHVRKKYEQAYFSKIQKIVKQKTLLQ